ncbi:chemotaxis protein CheB [Sphingomonas montana]|uniref:chemotaxis protein CheB n=1 Tax=Sphingomonas montana TaxID=1843236 RepID=UPI00096FF7C3|nr:chemotaxis protein CheB [Sphingomonas montana]
MGYAIDQGQGTATGDAATTRVLIVDDSIVARTVFQRMLDEHPRFSVCGVARGVASALALLADMTVDIVLLDVEMPGMDGLTALPAILTAGRGAHVVIVSSSCGEGAVASMRALALGASDTVLKPAAGDLGSEFTGRLAQRLQRLPPVRHFATPTTGDVAPGEPVVSQRRDPVGCIAVGASTGGLIALTALFEGLDARCTAPILVTQHLPPEFMPYFADQLSEIAGRRATVAEEGETVSPGQVLVAPGTAHLTLLRDGDAVRVRYDRRPLASACLPSVDPMLIAVADVFAASGIGVILSGMGRDGAHGAAQLAAAGGEILVQDAGSATVWGMPGTVARARLADAILPPAAIGRHIVARALACSGARPGTQPAATGADGARGTAAWR